jgi:arabinogalactan endo-1,4-beta-galactosidase
MSVKIFFILLSFCSFIACHTKEQDLPTTQVQPAAPFVFAKGADVSWLPQMEASGYVFKDADGTPKDCLQLLKDRGMNAIRLRVFVNPSNDKIDGHCDKVATVGMAKRAKAMGFRIMIDFHYSDSWADPSKQVKPAAWKSFSIPQLGDAIYNHTLDVLTALKEQNVIPEWVQIGNEITPGMLLPEGNTSTGWGNLALFLNRGYEAVKSIDKSIKVVVHIDQGNNNQRFRWFFDNIKSRNVNYDVIGMSYYPYWLNSDYLASITDLENNMKDMVTRYGKEVMVVEVGGDFEKEDNTKAMLLATISAVKAVPNSSGLGVLYWEPQGEKSWSGYQLNCWRSNGTPSPALDAFK